MKDLSFDELVKLTTERLCRDTGIKVVHEVDFRMSRLPNGDVKYDALTPAGDFALRVMKAFVEANVPGGVQASGGRS